MKNVLHNFLQSDKRTLSVCGMAHESLRKLSMIKQIIEESGKKCVVLSPNSRLKVEDRSISIYSHLFITSIPRKNKKKFNQEEGFELKPSKQQKSSNKSKLYSLRENQDAKNCIYLLDNAHLLSDTKFVTPDGKQYGSGILLDDFFEFADFEGSERKAIFLVDPYQIQRNNKLLSECDEVFKLPLPDPDTLNSAQSKNMAHLAWAIEKQRFAVFDLAVDNNLLVQNDNTLAAQQLVSAYQGDSSVWYLAETHFHTHRLTQWLRPKLLQKTDIKPLESGDWVEIYVWPHEEKSNPIEDKVIIYPGNLEIIKEAMKPEEYSQGLKGRAQPILFHLLNCTLTRGESNQILLEFLIAEKPELDADTSIAVRAWENQNNKEDEDIDDEEDEDVDDEDGSIAYIRYGYAATVHHAQGMWRNMVYINCSHSAGKHSEGFFRWLYSALTVANSKTVLLNFTPIHPFDQAIWKTQNVQTEIPEKIRIGAGWTWQNDKESDGLKDYLSQIASRFGYTFTQIASYPYQEVVQLENETESFSLRLAYNGKNQVTAFYTNTMETYWKDLSAISQACIEFNQYSNNAQMLLLFLVKQLNPHNWLIVSAVRENDYRLNITFARACHERVSGEINFDKQGIVSSLRILACSQEHLVEELKGLLS